MLNDKHENIVGMYYVIYTEDGVQRKTYANLSEGTAKSFAEKVGGIVKQFQGQK